MRTNGRRTKGRGEGEGGGVVGEFHARSLFRVNPVIREEELKKETMKLGGGFLLDNVI